MSDLVILVGNPRAGSRTRALAAALAEAIVTELGARGVRLAGSRILELADVVAIGFSADAVAARDPQPDAIDAIGSARVLLVATPSYKGSYTGLLKVFLDQLPNQALAGVVAVPVAIAGSPAHVLATAADLRRLLVELGADAPAVVEVLESRLADIDGVVAQSAHSVAEELVGYLTVVAATVD